MSAGATAWVGVIGALVGGLTSFVGQWLLARASGRQHRGDVARESAAQLIAACEALITAKFTFVMNSELRSHGHDIRADPQDMLRAVQEVTVRASQFRVVCPPRLRSSAARVQTSTVLLVMNETGRPLSDASPDLLSAARAAVDEFGIAAYGELHAPTGLATRLRMVALKLKRGRRAAN